MRDALVEIEDELKDEAATNLAAAKEVAHT